jgi:hypothetical protein
MDFGVITIQYKSLSVPDKQLKGEDFILTIKVVIGPVVIRVEFGMTAFHFTDKGY